MVSDQNPGRTPKDSETTNCYEIIQNMYIFQKQGKQNRKQVPRLFNAFQKI